jgi:hypothetical protein
MVEGSECSGHRQHRQKLEKVHKTTKNQWHATLDPLAV